MIRLEIIDHGLFHTGPLELADLTDVGRQQIRYEAERLIEEIDEYEREHPDDDE